MKISSVFQHYPAPLFYGHSNQIEPTENCQKSTKEVSVETKKMVMVFFLWQVFNPGMMFLVLESHQLRVFKTSQCFDTQWSSYILHDHFFSLRYKQL